MGLMIEEILFIWLCRDSYWLTPYSRYSGLIFVVLVLSAHLKVSTALDSKSVELHTWRRISLGERNVPTSSDYKEWLVQSIHVSLHS